ncbi:MAG: GntR family transcriptional regulator [Pleurocapsa sp.]
MARSQKQIPLHIDISEQIHQQIISGDYLPGAKLPSERKLIEKWQVSRITIRRAIANLVQQGLVTTHQGKGAFVTQKRKVIYTLSNPLTFLEDDLSNQGIELSLQNITFEPVTAPKEVQAMLQLPLDNPTAYLQKKILLADQEPGCVDITYILPEIGHQLESELKQNMTFPILERHNWKIDQVKAIIECTNANLELSEYLDVPLGHPLLVYRHTAYSNNRPVVHGESISRGDRFCYSVNQVETVSR